MRALEKRIGIAAVVLALGACSDDDGPKYCDGRSDSDCVPEDEPSEDESAQQEEASPATAADSGPRKRDASVPPAAEDAGLDEPSIDAGRGNRRDASTTPDATARDAANPTASSDAAVPAGDHCAPTASWDPQWASYEDEVLRLCNEARAAGHNCDTKGNFGPAAPLTMEPRLRCAARLYSKEMSDTGNFSHDSVDGTKFNVRIERTGYRSTGLLGENIAANQQTPAEVVKAWLDSDGHCANIMNSKFKQLGVGVYIEAASGPRGRPKPYWTQEFGESSR